MHKLKFIVQSRPFQPRIQFVILCSVFFSLVVSTFGQSKEQVSPPKAVATVSVTRNAALPDKLRENWRAVAPPRLLTATQCQVLPDGDIYAEYGLQNLVTRFYTNGKTKIAVELFQMRFSSEAYGLFTFIRGTKTKKAQIFYTGSFLVNVSDYPEGSSESQSFLDALKASIVSDEGELPSLPFNLPEQGKLTETEKYVVGPLALAQIKEFTDLKDVVKFAGGTQAAAANYATSSGPVSLIIIEYHTPQLATDGYGQIQNYYNSLSSQEKASRLLRRIGNYVVSATNVRDTSSAESLIGSIKYSPKVYWEGKKLTDIPIRFRPPDPLAIEEASQTAKVIIRTFYWIGVMIFGAIVIGFITGGSFFYWRRHRRRKLGLDDIFSDAGGTVRLNLDEYLLLPEKSSIPHLMDEKKHID